MSFLDRLGLSVPLIQAPMAGVSTPRMAADVSNAGALGSIGIGATDARGARAMIEELRSRTDRPFSVKLFVHPAPRIDSAREAAWLESLAPVFAQFGAETPRTLQITYKSFGNDPEMLAMLLETAPPRCQLSIRLAVSRGHRLSTATRHCPPRNRNPRCGSARDPSCRH